MATTGHRTEELYFDLALDIIFAKICSSDLNLVPIETISSWALDLRLIDRLPLVLTSELLVDQEKVKAAHRRESCSHLHLDFLLRAHVALLSSDLNRPASALGTRLIYQGLDEGLVTRRHYLVNRKFE